MERFLQRVLPLATIVVAALCSNGLGEFFQRVVPCGFVIAGSATALQFAYQFWLASGTRRWPHATGTITRTYVVHRRDEGEDPEDQFSPRAEYRYQAMGQSFQSNSGQFRVVDSKGTRSWADGELNRFKHNPEVLVYFNPRKPSQSVLERGAAQGNLLLGSAFCVGLAALGVWWLGELN